MVEETIYDYITGMQKANCGAEANRQAIERLLVDKLGYGRTAIEVDVPISIEVQGQRYTSKVDLAVSVHNHRYMVIKCAAGSLASREREVIAAARLLDEYQIPLAVASDGKTSFVWDTVSGEEIGSGLGAIPSFAQACERFDPNRLVELEESRRIRQMLIYRSYDVMNIHR